MCIFYTNTFPLFLPISDSQYSNSSFKSLCSICLELWTDLFICKMEKRDQNIYVYVYTCVYISMYTYTHIFAKRMIKSFIQSYLFYVKKFISHFLQKKKLTIFIKVSKKPSRNSRNSTMINNRNMSPSVLYYFKL